MSMENGVVSKHAAVRNKVPQLQWAVIKNNSNTDICSKLKATIRHPLRFHQHRHVPGHPTFLGYDSRIFIYAISTCMICMASCILAIAMFLLERWQTDMVNLLDLGMYAVRIIGYVTCMCGARCRNWTVILVSSVFVVGAVFVNTGLSTIQIFWFINLQDDEVKVHHHLRDNLRIPVKMYRTFFLIYLITVTSCVLYCHIIFFWACIVYASHLKSQQAVLSGVASGVIGVTKISDDPFDAFLFPYRPSQQTHKPTGRVETSHSSQIHQPYEAPSVWRSIRKVKPPPDRRRKYILDKDDVRYRPSHYDTQRGYVTSRIDTTNQKPYETSNQAIIKNVDLPPDLKETHSMDDEKSRENLEISPTEAKTERGCDRQPTVHSKASERSEPQLIMEEKY